MVAQVLLLAGLLPVCSVGPGLFFVRRLRWAPAEKLSASIGLSLVVVYATSLLIYALGMPRYAYVAVSAGCLLLTAWSFRDLLRLLRNHAVRRQVRAFGFLFVWGLLLMALVRHFSGGMWAGDWLEHYERTRFFLEHWPREFSFLGLYPLPARPPLMNLVAAHFLAPVGTGYPLFQLVFLFLNLLVFFPLCLMLSVFARGGRRRLPVLVALLVASPMLWQNATFTWTKLLTAFYVVLGLELYLAAWRKGDRARMVATFASLSAGFLVHFSAGPYALFLGLHYLAFVFPWREGRWREAAAAGLVSAALLATWFGWSVAVYGAGPTFASNTTAAELGGESAGGALAKVAGNVFSSTVPHPFRVPREEFDQLFRQRSPAGWLRDYLFLVYQTNIVFSMGLVGGPMVVYLLVRTLLGRSEAKGPERRFWLLFVVFGSLAGIAAHPTLDRYGVAHICSQPMSLLGLAFLAARYPTLAPAGRWLVVLGCVLDFSLGVALHFGLENRTFPFTGGEEGVRFARSGDLLSTQALLNYAGRVLKGLTYWGDYFTGADGLIGAVLALGLFVVMTRMVSFARRPEGKGV